MIVKGNQSFETIEVENFQQLVIAHQDFFLG